MGWHIQSAESKIIYLEKLLLRNEGKIDIPDKQKLWEFIVSKTTLKEILKGFSSWWKDIRQQLISNEEIKNTIDKH